ncbi:MAG: HNH endonuclease [Polyangiaceae bacterium]|nr:HNH endonuclease [Polyangiaceae bacterium]
MDASLMALVRKRARSQCEYCRLPAAFSAIPFEIDHVLAQKHGGLTHEQNLALSCFYCNSHKGSRDPRTYSPRA